MTDQQVENQPTPQKNVTAWVAVVMFLVAYLGDQASKLWVVKNMSEGESIPVIPPLLHWYFIRNSGAAFSIGTGYTWIFTIIQAVALVVVIWLLVATVKTTAWYFTLGALAGGIAGNLTDRFFREPSFGQGHVVDFISLPNFAIFNVADMMIVGSMGLIIVLVLMGKTMDGAPVEEDDDEESSDAAEEVTADDDVTATQTEQGS